jgi:hypothetical protein
MVPLSSAAGDRRVNATASRVIDHVTMWPDFLPNYHLGDYPSLGRIQKGQDGPIFKVGATALVVSAWVLFTAPCLARNCGPDQNGANTGKANYIEVYTSKYAMWCVDESFWPENSEQIKKFFPYYDGVAAAADFAFSHRYRAALRGGNHDAVERRLRLRSAVRQEAQHHYHRQRVHRP